MDSFFELLLTIQRHKMRTFLTAFGVFWGVFILVLLLGTGRGIENGILRSFEGTVPDFIVVYPSTTSEVYKGFGLGRQINLLESDVAAIKDTIPGIRFISAAITLGSSVVTYRTQKANIEIMGVADDYFDIKETIQFGHGRSYNPLDNQHTRKVALVGRSVAQRLFGLNNISTSIAQNIQIKGISILVVGIFDDKENHGLSSERIYLPMSTYKKIFGGSNTIRDIWLRPEKGVNSQNLEKEVVTLIKQRHHVSPTDRKAIRSFNMAEPVQKMNNLFLGIRLFIWFIGLGTFTAGVVGVGNIMIISVKERTREIGIRKAIGATSTNIVSSIVFEAMLITSLAGYTGLVFGTGCIELMGYLLQDTKAGELFFTNPEINFSVLIIAIILLTVTGAISGLIPAIKATRIMPIEAMRAN